MKKCNTKPHSMVITVWKEFGETMTGVLGRALLNHGISEPATYAGRLDPTASGVVVILTGEDRFKKNEYLSSKKTYTVSLLIGIQTDTDDIFGVVESFHPNAMVLEDYSELCQQLVGPIVQPIHAFSAYRHKGTPLWKHSQTGEFPIIQKNRTIYEISVGEIQTISLSAIKSDIESLLHNDQLQNYRLSEIQNSWRDIPDTGLLQFIPMSITVSSGTFIRSIARTLGTLFNVPVCAYHITRTSIELNNSTQINITAKNDR